MDANHILKQAGEHFARVVSDQDLMSVDVPEWGTTLYYPRALSLAALSRITEAQAKGGLHHVAQTVIECARDENGRKVFSSSHMDHMMKKVDPSVLARIAGEMSSALMPEENVMGKSVTTVSSDPGTD